MKHRILKNDIHYIIQYKRWWHPWLYVWGVNRFTDEWKKTFFKGNAKRFDTLSEAKTKIDFISQKEKERNMYLKKADSKFTIIETYENTPLYKTLERNKDA